MALRSFLIFLFTGLLMISTPQSAKAQESCRDLFRLPEPSTQGTLSLINDPQLDSWIDLYRAVPSLLPHITFEMMGIARVHLIEARVQFTERRQGQSLYFVITPSEATTLNRFALDMKKTYGAEVGFMPEALITIPAVTFVVRLSSGDPLTAGTSFLGLGWAQINSLKYFNPYRDIATLHEIRHLKFNAEMDQYRPNALHGEIHLAGKLPNDPYASHEVYSNYLSFSEVRTFHTQVKEEITTLRRLLRRGADPIQLSLWRRAVRESLRTLTIVSSRTALAIQTVYSAIEQRDPLLNSFYEFRNGVVQARITYEGQAQGFELMMFLPIVKAGGLTDPKIHFYTAEHMRAVLFTATRAHEQSLRATELYTENNSQMSVADQVSILDQVQRSLGTYPIFGNPP